MLGVLIVYLSHIVDRLISRPAHSIFKEEGGGFIHNNIEHYMTSIMYSEHAFAKGLKKISFLFDVNLIKNKKKSK